MRIGPLSRKVLGGMVATPWFAVGAGLMVVAWIALESPGTRFSFPSAPQAVCRAGQCLSTPGGTPAPGSTGGAGLNGAKGGQLPFGTVRPGGGPAARLAVTAPQSGVLVRYSVQRSGNHFVAVFVVIGKHDLGTWALGMTIPGARINVIMGASWNGSGPGTGVVSGTPPPWQDSGLSSARFVIMGTGWLGEPRGCQFDGEPCTFLAMADG